MSDFHQKRLQSYQKQMKELQEKLQKTEQDLGASLLKALKKRDALSLDMNTLVGGFFEVIDKIRKGDPQMEQWNKIGKAYFKKSIKSLNTEEEK